MNADLHGLPSQAVEEICSVLAGHSAVERAILYGSRAKGNFKRGSDIDLTLVGSGVVYRDLLEIMDELDDLLLPYTIDLSILHLIDHAGLREHIERVGKEFYRRQDADMAQPAQLT